MSSTNGAHQTSRLRRASAKHRLNAFLEQISTLEESNFPHPDGLDALKKLKVDTEQQLKRLARCPVDNEALIDRLYQQARLTVGRYTPILGFILRSTNVRNAFEVHFPLKRVTKMLIGSDAKLIISSEWGFVPFTYPMSLDQLPNFALVGGPASESGNVLTIPVAGHEIGHSAWRRHAPSLKIEPRLLNEIDKSLSFYGDETARLSADIGGGPRAKEKLQRLAFINGLKQLEEIFCDASGLYIFGSSFLYAMEYFLAPGGGPRSLTYPGDLYRLELILLGASKLGLTYTQPIFERWTDSVLQATQSRDFIVILDSAVKSLAPKLLDEAFDLFDQVGLIKPDAEKIEKTIKSFTHGEPQASGANLAEIVSAGWEIVRKGGGLAEPKQLKKYRELGDLMLKSIEVAEFNVRTENA